MEMDAPFQTRQVGTIGHEILDPRGTVIVWAVDAAWAMVVVALLNEAESDGIRCKPVCAAQPTKR